MTLIIHTDSLYIKIHCIFIQNAVHSLILDKNLFIIIKVFHSEYISVQTQMHGYDPGFENTDWYKTII